MRTLQQSFSLLLRGSLVAATLAWVGIGHMQAEELKDCLVVHMVNGNSVSYVLEDTPKVTFVEDKLHIEATSISDDHLLANVDKFTFEKSTGVESITTNNLRITITNDYVTMEGATPGAIVNIVDIQGRLTLTTRVNDSGNVTMSLTDLSAGVYVVATSDGKTFKLLKK